MSKYMERPQNQSNMKIPTGALSNMAKPPEIKSVTPPKKRVFESAKRIDALPVTQRALTVCPHCDEPAERKVLNTFKTGHRRCRCCNCDGIFIEKA